MIEFRVCMLVYERNDLIPDVLATKIVFMVNPNY